jgi:hypothetical protein
MKAEEIAGWTKRLRLPPYQTRPNAKTAADGGRR